jgi:hypothetical protein
MIVFPDGVKPLQGDQVAAFEAWQKKQEQRTRMFGESGGRLLYLSADGRMHAVQAVIPPG